MPDLTKMTSAEVSYWLCIQEIAEVLLRRKRERLKGEPRAETAPTAQV